MKLSSFSRRVVTAAPTCVVVLFGALLYQSSRHAVTVAHWVEHTHRVMLAVEQMLSDLKDAEIGQRGYLFTGQDVYLAPYEATRRDIAADIAALRRLTADNPAQQVRLDALEPLVSVKLDELAAVIELRSRHGSVPDWADLATEQGERSLDAIRRLGSAMVAEEQELLAARQAADERREQILLTVIVGGTALAAFLTLLLNLILSRHARLQESAADELADKTHRLEEQTAELEVERAYLEELFASAPEGVVVVDADDRIARANPEFTRLFGYAAETAVGRTVCELIVPAELREEALGITRQVARGERMYIETTRLRKDGTRIPVSVLGAPVRVRDSQVAVYGIYRDISEEKAAEAALERLAITDELTGLANRRGFFSLVEQQRKLAHRAGRDLLLVFVDLDDFKSINDTYGHREGDRVLADVARLLRNSYRESDIIARLGGDEFVVLAVDACANAEEVLLVRLQHAVQQFNHRSGRPYRISISAGASWFSPASETPLEELLDDADGRMYAQKHARGPGMDIERSA